MPLLPSYRGDDAEQAHTKDQWDEVLGDIRSSPGYQLLTDDEDCVPGYHSLPSQDGEITAMSSPRSDTTIKPGDNLASGGVALSLVRHDNEPHTLMSPNYGAMGEKTSIHVLGPQQSSQASTSRALPLSSHFGVPEVAHIDTPHQGRTKFQTGDLRSKIYSRDQDPFVSSPVSAIGSFRRTTSLEVRVPANAQPMHGFAPGTPSTRSSAHHRHTSSHFSFVPVLTSRLGPGRLEDGSGSGVSGVVPTVPTKQRSDYVQHLHPNSVPERKTSTSQQPLAIPFSWTQSTSGSYSPFDMSPVNDPFMDEYPAAETHSVEGSTSGYTPNRSRAPTPTTPECGEFPPDEPFHSVTGLSINDTGPAPPPALPTSQFVRQPDVQARLDAQKTIRKNWIEREARKLAAAARTAAILQKQYHSTRRHEDFRLWIHAQADCEQAWSVERLMEERRNLTLPEGMRALKTGRDSLPEDGLCGVESGILGHKMALMERLCADAMMKDDKCKMAAERLDENAKRAVRQAVMRDVETGTEKRLGRQIHRREGDARTAQHQY